jgi:EAL domain-containing protein (putative c-di-GMP-specific phosphodiesterase class I)
VAEGIETAEEAATLRSFGVEFGQGFLLGHPAEASTWTIPRRRTNGSKASRAAASRPS